MDEHKEVTRYKWEYKNFLEYVEKGDIAHAMIYAKALKIDRRTFSHWMQQPALREALQLRIDKLVKKMESSGFDDWRMWRELLKMIGVDDAINVDITSDGEKMQAATIIDVGNLKNGTTDQPEASTDSGDDQAAQS